VALVSVAAGSRDNLESGLQEQGQGFHILDIPALFRLEGRWKSEFVDIEVVIDTFRLA